MRNGSNYARASFGPFSSIICRDHPICQVVYTRIHWLGTFFLGFSAGIFLAFIDWLRMKMIERAIIHLFAGAAGTVIFFALFIMTPGSAGRLLTAAVNLGILFLSALADG